MTDKPKFRIFRPPCGLTAAHSVSDLQHWQLQFDQIYGGNLEHYKSLEDLYKTNDNRFKYSDVNKFKAPVPDSVEKLESDLTQLQEKKREDIRGLDEAHKTCYDIRLALNGLKDKEESIEQLVKVYTEAREALTKQDAVVDKSKMDFHKFMFKIEKATVNSKLATKPSTVYKTEAKIKSMLKKSETYFERYDGELETWRQIAEALFMIAAELESRFIEKECKRADLVLGNLAACFNNDKTGFKSDNGDVAFRGISSRELLVDAVDKMKDTITIKEYESYKAGEIDDTYDAAKAALLDEESDIDSESEDPDLDEQIDTEFKHDILVNKRLKQLRESQVFIVTKTYEACKPSEINLEVGERVIKLLPANSYGYAFGEVTRGTLRRKKKGFYPDDHVALLDDGIFYKSNYGNRDYMEKVIKKLVAREQNKVEVFDFDIDESDADLPMKLEAEESTDLTDFSEDDEYEADDLRDANHPVKSKIKSLIRAVIPKMNESRRFQNQDAGECVTAERCENKIMMKMNKFVNASKTLTSKDSNINNPGDDGDTGVMYKWDSLFKNSLKAKKTKKYIFL